ncbi:acyl-CoA thioesterase [Flammeovirgaceae bacterium SG7u.111]|nr:acyl-CoA thioesterase [Flammeovirgaceae bacterium SG7u.132]WPO37590.1 acyl-CoA thioesterase [Flammeovirgaceae bacterium SG7u.111]
MSKIVKTPLESLVNMMEMVMPNDTNPLNNLMGGRLMHHMDIAAAISAQRHSNSVVVTASVDNVSFDHAIPMGNIVSFESKVTRAFKTSMEVYIKVVSENIPKGHKTFTNHAFFTFVAVNSEGRPVEVPAIKPETEEEKKFYEDALQRRQLRLIMAGRLKPTEAPELKALFVKP